MTRILLCALLCFLSAASASPADDQRVPVAMHVHSNWSGDGVLTLDQIAQQAAAGGIRAVILGDHCLMKTSYGLFPLRGLIKKSLSKGSVLSNGPAAWLKEIESVNDRHTGVVLIPGVEAAAHWFWTGSLLTKDLTLHDWHKHMLVAGMYEPDDYTRMPITGNEKNSGGFAPFLLWPVFLIIAGLMVFIAFHTRTIALILCFAGIIGLANNWPFKELPRAGDPYQRLIDYASQRSPGTGILFWNHPDAPDYADPVKYGRVFLHTPRYSSVLKDTAGYTGFAYFQEGDKETGSAGGTWDAVLGDYCSGKRSEPAWASAELDYRTEGRLGTYIDSYQNVVLLPSDKQITAPMLLRALQAGRFYAVTKPHGKPELVLEEFSAAAAGGRAGMGEEVSADGTITLTIALRLADTTAGAVSCSVISGGSVIARRNGVTPVTFVLRLPAHENLSYYRVEASAANRSRLVSNPLFVRR